MSSLEIAQQRQIELYQTRIRELEARIAELEGQNADAKAHRQYLMCWAFKHDQYMVFIPKEIWLKAGMKAALAARNPK